MTDQETVETPEQLALEIEGLRRKITENEEWGEIRFEEEESLRFEIRKYLALDRKKEAIALALEHLSLDAKTVEELLG
jgi:hypothetical protein